MRNNFCVCYLIPSDVVCILSRSRPYTLFLGRCVLKNSSKILEYSSKLLEHRPVVLLLYATWIFFSRAKFQRRYTQNGGLLKIIGRRRPSMQTLNMQVHRKIRNCWKYNILRGKYKLRYSSEIISKTTKFTTCWCSWRKSDYRMEICMILTFRWITNNFIVDVTLNN